VSGASPISDTAPAYTNADFLTGFQRLLPTGPVWPRDSDAVQTQVFEALVSLYTANAESAAELLVDAFPATTVFLLPEWQATLGLPDPCAGPAATLAQSQAQVLARFTAVGGQSIPYFISFAKALGYDITIDQFAPFRVGAGAVGAPLYGTAWAFAWQVNAPDVTINSFIVGDSEIGDPLQAFTNTVLECELQRLAPAHTTVIFNFVS
jgi:uncharacterized protein YmfQ (DUF2313 family)